MSAIEIKPEGATTDELARLREVAQDHGLANAIEAVREFLGMDVAYATEMTDTEQRFIDLQGDGESFGVAAGISIPIEQTYCQRILAGRLPNVIPDVRGDERAASLPITESAGVGAFASVPLMRSDGELFGTLCAASHEARPSLGYRELQFLHVFARMISDQIEVGELREEAHERERRLTATSILMNAVEARDAYTADHSHLVVDLAVSVCRRLDLEAEVADNVAQVALLHDIGKLSIPDSILRKPGPLDAEEWEEMRRHPIYGEQLIAKAPGLEHLARAVRAEHERWDGGGYPDGLSGSEIPLESRIVLACDAYHAMISDRPYRRAMSMQAAMAELSRGSGSQFDPEVVRALLRALEIG